VVEDEARAVIEAASAAANAARERGAHDAEAILDEARRQDELEREDGVRARWIHGRLGR
jgi:hypothetical protein